MGDTGRMAPQKWVGKKPLQRFEGSAGVRKNRRGLRGIRMVGERGGPGPTTRRRRGREIKRDWGTKLGSGPTCSSFPWEAGGRPYNADPSWDSGKTNSHKQNRGCFLSPQTRAQATPASPAEDGEAEPRVRADRAGACRGGQDLAGLQRTHCSGKKSN